MEDFKKNQERDKDIVFSKSVKAGKRIYYVDVKKNRKGELFIALTESKKVISGDTESPSINFEKHKYSSIRRISSTLCPGWKKL